MSIEIENSQYINDHIMVIKNTMSSQTKEEREKYDYYNNMLLKVLSNILENL